MTKSHLSVQLYSVREAMQADPEATLKRIAEIGFSQVEPYNFMEFPELGAALAASGLSAPTTHGHFIGEDERNLANIFAAARSLGVDRVIDPHVGPESWQTASHIAATAESLNAAARVASDNGVTVGYHNHAHELESMIAGRTALETFVEQLDPAVGLEIDTYWVAVGGQDPVELLKRLGDRVVAIHVKDGAATTDPKDQVAVGSGSLPIRAIIEAVPQALRVVELDDCRGDRFTAVADSFAYLVRENLA